MARGGKRTPAKPAAVSGPGALSRRTDGGAGQPIRLATGQPYGQRADLETQQQAAPLAAGGGPAPRPGMATQGPPPQAPNVFGPPSGAPAQAAPTNLDPLAYLAENDPQALIRLLYRKYPTPQLARLLGDN